MKARVKGTNELVEVEYNGTTYVSCGRFRAKDGRIYPYPALEFEKDIDWETRRYELAKEYSKEFVRLQHYQGISENGLSNPKVVEWSIELADALIKALKGEEG